MARSYGGLLVTSREVWTIAGIVRKTHDNPDYGTCLARLSELPLAPNMERFSFTEQSPKAALATATAHLVDAYPDIAAIGVGSYGPLEAVNPLQSGYGTVSERSRHVILQKLKVYDIVAKTAEKRLGRKVRTAVHTDVVAGALAEFGRRRYMDCPGEDRVGDGETLAFIHVADGIGGACVSGRLPLTGALHPEVGYIAAAIDPRDSWGQRQVAVNEGINQMVVIEDVASESALRVRAGLTAAEYDDGAWAHRIPRKLWSIESYYVSQLCASMTMMVAPHKFIVHSPFIGNALLGMIRVDFDRWVSRRGGRYLRYQALESTSTFIRRPVKPAPMRFGALCLAIKADLEI